MGHIYSLYKYNNIQCNRDCEYYSIKGKKNKSKRTNGLCGRKISKEYLEKRAAHDDFFIPNKIK